MADFESQLRGLIDTEARKRRRDSEWWWGSAPNTAGISRQLGISQATVYRILYGREYRTGEVDPITQENVSPQVLRAIREFYRLSSTADAYEMIENSVSVAPLPQKSKKRPRG